MDLFLCGASCCAVTIHYSLLMILFLTSSPCLEGDSHINPINGFVEALQRTVKPSARVLFVSAAPDDEGFSDYCAESMFCSLKSCGLEFSSCTSLDRRTAKKTAKLVQRSDFIVMEGGHVPTQNQFMQEIGLRKLMESFDGVVMGISAGSMNSADVVYAQPEEPGESLDPEYRRFLPGLGLTKTMILPHYQKVCNNMLDGRRLYEDITFGDSYGRRFYVFPDGTYLMRENGRETVYGDCWLLEDGIMRKICRTGRSVRI